MPKTKFQTRSVSLALQSLCLVLSCYLLVQAFAGCGRKGPPIPPESFFPSAVLGLTATGTPEGVSLSWVAPARTQNGGTLRDLASFSIRRRVTDANEDFSEIATVVVNPKQAPAPKSGETNESYVFLDKSAAPATTYDYLVVPFNASEDEGLLGVVVRAAKQEQAG